MRTGGPLSGPVPVCLRVFGRRSLKRKSARHSHARPRRNRPNKLCKQGVRGSSPLSSTRQNAPTKITGRGACATSMRRPLRAGRSSRRGRDCSRGLIRARPGSVFRAGSGHPLGTVGAVTEVLEWWPDDGRGPLWGKSGRGGVNIDVSSLGLPPDLVTRLTEWNASYQLQQA